MWPISVRLPSPLPLQGQAILVVEDEPIIAMHLDAVLTDAGGRVLGPAASNARALALIARETPTVAILDVRLGAETSAPVACRLSELGVPFLFYTGQFDVQPLRDTWPASPVLAKPAAAADLLQAVAGLGAAADDDAIAGRRAGVAG